MRLTHVAIFRQSSVCKHQIHLQSGERTTSQTLTIGVCSDRELLQYGGRRSVEHLQLGCVRDPVLSRDLYERYVKICGRLDADSVSERRVRDHLSDMNMLGLINLYETERGALSWSVSRIRA